LASRGKGSTVIAVVAVRILEIGERSKGSIRHTSLTMDHTVFFIYSLSRDISLGGLSSYELPKLSRVPPQASSPLGPPLCSTFPSNGPSDPPHVSIEPGKTYLIFPTSPRDTDVIGRTVGRSVATSVERPRSDIQMNRSVSASSNDRKQDQASVKEDDADNRRLGELHPLVIEGQEKVQDDDALAGTSDGCFGSSHGRGERRQ
jgi:hypothetical protein